ncbi:protein ZNF365 [Falco biarmicus]|uniref:FBX41/ZN365 C2H2-type zinc finger domain-containing protein n=1 Tax=Falco tinnunculus TaxID=100819 RepID=A0A8C4UG91_FALTI|nr:protein ZNF365 [Falco peregrinus]XP_027653030.2 protein ZNF365 [Falco cherrug]XP_037256255.1 protein ZNF365 [Falco rusticolus]XP_056208251.1 protein ZNF365 [Falco biarmicus]
MQQTARDEGRHPWQEPLGSISLPFRCPRCGDNTRFRSLSSLRVHLEYSHSYEERSLLSKGSLFSPLKDAELGSPPEPATQGGPGSSGGAIQPKGSYLNFCDASCGSGQPLEVEAERPVSYVANYVSADSPSEQVSKPGLPAADSKASFEAHVREKFNRMVEAVDKTIEKRIDKLTKELAQKTAELLEVRAAFVQLSQKKQEVQRRERALSRQVDVAVEMIAALKQRLSESEEELHRKEEEVVTFNHFLEEAAEKEVRGKARLQHFIENLLQRVDLAERQLEYYQNQQMVCNHTDINEHVLTDISLNKKPRCLSRGSQHALYNIPEAKPHSFQKGRILLKKAKDEKTSLQPLKCFYEPVDCPREIWRAQKKAEPVCSARKVSVKSKMGKKAKPL